MRGCPIKLRATLHDFDPVKIANQEKKTKKDKKCKMSCTVVQFKVHPHRRKTYKSISMSYRYKVTTHKGL